MVSWAWRFCVSELLLIKFMFSSLLIPAENIKPFVEEVIVVSNLNVRKKTSASTPTRAKRHAVYVDHQIAPLNRYKFVNCRVCIIISCLHCNL